MDKSGVGLGENSHHLAPEVAYQYLRRLQAGLDFVLVNMPSSARAAGPLERGIEAVSIRSEQGVSSGNRTVEDRPSGPWSHSGLRLECRQLGRLQAGTSSMRCVLDPCRDP